MVNSNIMNYQVKLSVGNMYCELLMLCTSRTTFHCKHIPLSSLLSRRLHSTFLWVYTFTLCYIFSIWIRRPGEFLWYFCVNHQSKNVAETDQVTFVHSVWSHYIISSYVFRWISLSIWLKSVSCKETLWRCSRHTVLKWSASRQSWN